MEVETSSNNVLRNNTVKEQFTLTAAEGYF